MVNDKQSSRFPFLSILFLIFLVLKLTNYIDWSWWWVTAPMWGDIAIIGGVGIVTIIIMYFKRILNK